MARNRIIHNVQDVFVGSTPDEVDNLVTGIVDHQLLKRITRVQTFSYSINTPQDDALSLGKSVPFSRKSNTPPQVSMSMSYLLNGIDNENRIGLNTGVTKCINHDILSSKTKDTRNFYLTINEQEENVHKHDTFPNPFALSEGNVGDPYATGYSVVSFQNCYLDSYDLSISPQSLPEVSLSYTADNMVGYSSGSGIEIPKLQAKQGNITGDGTEFIIPKSFKDDSNYTSSFTKDYSRTVVSINPSSSNGVTGFLADEITNCKISFSIDREDVSYVGHKLVSERKPKLPAQCSLDIDTLVSENITGSFLDNMNENENYDVTVDLKSKGNETLAKFIFSGAKFESLNYEASIATNKVASLQFSNYIDLENQNQGLFAEGKITTAMSGSTVLYPQF